MLELIGQWWPVYATLAGLVMVARVTCRDPDADADDATYDDAAGDEETAT